MTILIIIQIIIALLLILLVLLQHSDNEGLGLGGGGGSLGGLMSARGSANLLSKSTAIVATLFMVMSIVMTIVAASNNEKKILESLTNSDKNSENDTKLIEEPVIPDSN